MWFLLCIWGLFAYSLFFTPVTSEHEGAGSLVGICLTRVFSFACAACRVRGGSFCFLSVGFFLYLPAIGGRVGVVDKC